MSERAKAWIALAKESECLDSPSRIVRGLDSLRIIVRRLGYPVPDITNAWIALAGESKGLGSPCRIVRKHGISQM